MTTAPPIAPLDLDNAPPPAKWVKVVGILSVVFSLLGLVCGGIGAIMMLFMGPMMEDLVRQAYTSQGVSADAEIQPMMPTGLSFGIYMAIAMAWTVLLLVAGIALLRRSPKSLRLHLFYAIGGVLLAFWGGREAMVQMNAQRAWADRTLEQQPSTLSNGNPNPLYMAAQQSKQFGAFGFVQVGVNVLIAIAWPGFCLLWFGFIKRAPESMYLAETIDA